MLLFGSGDPFDKASDTANVDSSCVQSHRCAHCSLPVPANHVEEGATHQFCCAGCRTVFEVLNQAGLEEYYAFRARLDEQPVRPASVTGRPYAELDTDTFRSLYVKELSSGAREVELALDGVHCAACVWLVEKLPALCPAVQLARLDLGRAVVRVTWDPTVGALSEIARVLDRMGYEPRPARGSSKESQNRRELRRMLLRLGVAGASAGNVMLMAFALYSDALGNMLVETKRFFEWGSLVASLPALWAAGTFFRGAWAAVRTRTPHMDLPIAIGILVGFLWGGHNVLLGAGEIYFDSVTALIFLLLVGRYVQRRHQVAASDAAELMHAVSPATARVEASDGAITERPVDTVAVGDRVHVLSGQIVPVDGLVVQGVSSLDMSFLSGESLPVGVEPGDSVQAGAVNLGSALITVCERAAADCRVAGLMRDVERALGERAPLVALSDRVAGVFTVAVLLLAAATFGYWATIDWSLAVDHALALLIVACPCALGLATPLSLSSAVRQAAARKILVKGGEVIERLARPALFVFDKTGTLTEGRLRLARWVGDPSLRVPVHIAEGVSSHPIAVALRRDLEPASKQASTEWEPRVQSMREVLGRGLEARLDGERLLVGAESFVRKHGVELPPDLEGALTQGLAEGLSPVLVSLGTRVRAIAFVVDPPRADAAESLIALMRRGHRLALLSGDHPDVVRAIARQLAERAGRRELFVDVLGGVTPEEKLRWIRERTLECPTVMVGDGVNDAGALAAATVGVAVHGAAEASLLSADAFLSRRGVAPVVELVRGAARTLRVIRRGILFSLAYNVVGVSLAATGILGPLSAAVLMPLSSLTVITNAYRSRTFARPRRTRGGSRPGERSGSLGVRGELGLDPPGGSRAARTAAPAEVRS